MDNYYRIRALVDGSAEERVCLGKNPDEAMANFENLKDAGESEPFGVYGLLVVMVHQIRFGESGPEFDDVTHQLSAKWERAGYEASLRYYPNLPKDAGNE